VGSREKVREGGSDVGIQGGREKRRR